MSNELDSLGVGNYVMSRCDARASSPREASRAAA